jgi:hypothetical protein
MFITLFMSGIKLRLTYVKSETFMVVKMCYVILGYDLVAGTNSSHERTGFISGP